MPREQDAAAEPPAERFEVVHDRVCVRGGPSLQARVVGVLKCGTAVSGWRLENSEGEPWLRLDGGSRRGCLNPADADEEDAFVLLHGRSLGLGLGTLLRSLEEELKHRARGRLDELGETALIAAVRQGDRAVVERLLTNRANPNEQDGFAETALMEAASLGDEAVCRLLLRHCGDPMHRSQSGLSARDLAAEHQQLREPFRDAEFWREESLRTFAGLHDYGRAKELLSGQQEAGLDLARVDDEGGTVLHTCAGRPPEQPAAVRVAKLLLQARASVNATNLLGETPLILAVRASADARARNLRLELPREFIAARADLNVSDAVLHETALMEAAGIGDAELVVLLLEARADHARASANGHTALHFAREPEVAGLLRDPQRAVQEWRGRRRQRHARQWPSPFQRQFVGVRPGAPGPAAAPVAQGAAAGPPAAQPRRPSIMEERIEMALFNFPGFGASGMQIPPEALQQQWTVSELNLFCGSMGQLWPSNRKRVFSSPAGGSHAQEAVPPGPPRARVRPPMSVLRPHCRVLGLSDTAPPDQQGLRKAYRQQALRWHPDKNAGNPEAAQKFQEALAAYEALRKALDFRD